MVSVVKLFTTPTKSEAGSVIASRSYLAKVVARLDGR